MCVYRTTRQELKTPRLRDSSLTKVLKFYIADVVVNVYKRDHGIKYMYFDFYIRYPLTVYCRQSSQIISVLGANELGPDEISKSFHF